jgi:AcrR family transcriptional regulator
MADTKERILDVTGELFRRYGYTGTGLKRIVSDASAPFGSVYHFFPGGKEQLGQEVIRRSGDLYLDLARAVITAAPDVATGVSDFFAGAAEVLRQTDYADACPIATVALEVASVNEPLREATDEVFESWVSWTAAHLAAAGIDARRARELAIFMVAALEGAFMLSRAARSTEAVDVAGAAATAAVRAALPPRPRRRHSGAGATARRPTGS